MKGFGKFLIVIGCLLLIASIAGFIMLSQTGVSGEYMDFAIGLSNAMGASAYMDGGSRFVVMLVQYRVTTLVAGLVCVVLGAVMAKSNKD